MSEYNCAIVVMSCDSYSDIWKGFFDLKDKYWSDCPFPCYIVTNSKKCERDNVRTILCGEEFNWTGRLRKALNEIDEELVILMLEDYFISALVSSKDINDSLDFMQKSGAVYYKLETRGTHFSTAYNNSSYVMRITPDIRYGVSLITSIWEKDFLIDVIGEDDYPAWEFEMRRNQSEDISKTTDKLLLCDTRNILNITHMVQRGKYLRRALRKLKRNGDNIDVGERKKINVLFEPYVKFVSLVKNHPGIRRFILNIMHSLGFKSVSEKYEDEIKNGTYK